MTSNRILILALASASLSLTACDREAGRKQETVGKIESGAGKLVGDKDLKSEGKTDKVAGNLKQGELKDAVKDAKK